mmetsp:Transcript_16819/g.41380  ORF Transcript_16819/g.41380 Transcript_16819/m.41380 type:complete len:156 (+) Transcript_16819:380-847(+)
MTAYLKCKSEMERYTHLRQDREQLSRILSHQNIRQSSYEKSLGARMCDTVFVFLNYKKREPEAVRKVAKAFVIDGLRLDKECTVLDEDSKRHIPLQNFVEDPKELRKMLFSDVEGEEWTRGCFYGRSVGFSRSFFKYNVKENSSRTHKNGNSDGS